MHRYQHYLRPEDEQLAKNVWDLVQQNNDPTNAPYHFTVRCSGGGAECPSGRYVLISLFSLNPKPHYIHLDTIIPPGNSFPHHPSSPHYHYSLPVILFSPFPFFFLCILTSRDNSLAITDATPRALPAVAQMLICPLFFTAPETAKDLQAKSYKQNPGRRDPPSWCSPGQKFSDFETAGHTLLHEMTHLDALGAAAGLSPRG